MLDGGTDVGLHLVRNVLLGEEAHQAGEVQTVEALLTECRQVLGGRVTVRAGGCQRADVVFKADNGVHAAENSFNGLRDECCASLGTALEGNLFMRDAIGVKEDVANGCMHGGRTRGTPGDGLARCLGVVDELLHRRSRVRSMNLQRGHQLRSAAKVLEGFRNMVWPVVALGEFTGDERADIDHVKGVAVGIFVQDGLGSLLARSTRQVDDVGRCAVHRRGFMHVGREAASRGVGTAASGESDHDLDRLFRIVCECCAARQHRRGGETRCHGFCEFHEFLPSKRGSGDSITVVLSNMIAPPCG